MTQFGTTPTIGVPSLDPVTAPGRKFAQPIISGSGAVSVVAGLYFGPVAGTNNFYAAGIYAEDQEVYSCCSAHVLPPVGESLEYYARVQNPGDVALATGYSIRWTRGTGFEFYKLTNGTTLTQLGTTFGSSINFQTGTDGFGMQVIGATLYGFFGTNVGSSGPPFFPSRFRYIGEVGDPDPITGPGYVGWGWRMPSTNNSGMRQAGGGSVVEPAASLRPPGGRGASW